MVTNVAPFLFKQGFKAGRAASYVRVCNGVIQMVSFEFRADEVCLEADIFPVFLGEGSRGDDDYGKTDYERYHIFESKIRAGDESGSAGSG